MTTDTDTLPAFARNTINLASAGLGAKGVFATDEFFAPLARMLADEPAVFYPERFDDHGKWMDGWETRRRREPGNDWIIVKLAARATVDRIVVDTAHFKGNYPDGCSLQVADLAGANGDLEALVTASSMFWEEILPEQKLSADSVHEFNGNIVKGVGPVTHVRLNIFPDGGVSRLRVFGQIAGAQ